MDRVNLEVTLPRGPEHYWAMMVELTRSAGGFTITDIWQLTNGRSRNTVKGYIFSCRDGGHIAADGQTADSAIRYRVINLNASAPIERRPEFNGSRGRVQQQIWNTMRGLPQFTIADLAVEASTDEVAVSHNAARAYVQALKSAGYLQTIKPSRRLKERGVFRLRPGMGDGPKAPAVLKTRFLVDRNQRKLVAFALADAEDAS